MPKWRVDIHRTVEYAYDVKAATAEEARATAIAKHRDGDPGGPVHVSVVEVEHVTNTERIPCHKARKIQ